MKKKAALFLAAMMAVGTAVPASAADTFCSLSPDAVRGPAVFPSIQEDKER